MRKHPIVEIEDMQEPFCGQLPTKNKGIKGDQIAAFSSKKFWWTCEDGHSWQQTVNKRVKSPITCWECTGKTSPGSGRKKPINCSKGFRALRQAY